MRFELSLLAKFATLFSKKKFIITHKQAKKKPTRDPVQKVFTQKVIAHRYQLFLRISCLETSRKKLLSREPTSCRNFFRLIGVFRRKIPNDEPQSQAD